MWTRLLPLALSVALSLASPAAGQATLVVPLGPPSAQEGPKPAVPGPLTPAVEALERGDTETALRLARDFVKTNPGSAVGHEVLGTAALAARQWAEAERALTQAVRLEPGRVSAMIRLGLLALETRSPKMAETWFRQAILAAPQIPVAHRLLGVALFRQGQADAALAAVQESLRLASGRDVESKYILGAMYHELGRPADAEPLLAEVLAQRPDLPQVLVLQGLVKLELRKLDEADALFERVVQRDPGSRWARLGLAVIDRARGDLADARTQFEKLAADQPDWPLVHFQLGQTLLQEGQREAALRAFDRAEQTSPNPSLARIRTAAVLLSLGHVDQAIARAKLVTASPTLAPSARALLVQAYLAKGDADGAEQELRQAVAAAPRDPSAPLQLGRFYLARGRPADALAQFQEAARRRPAALEPLVGLAEAYVALKQAAEAVAAAEKVVTARQDDANSYVFLGTIQERLSRPADAAKAYRQALDREPRHLAASRALARLVAREQNTAEAVRLLEDAAATHPGSVLPLLDLGVVYEAAGDTTQAVSAYRRALARDARSALALNNLAYLLGQDPKSLDEALGLAERAYQRAPGLPAVADTLGWLLYQNGELARAEKLLAQAAGGIPRNARVRYHLGMAYAKLGKTAEARRELEEALRLEAFPEANEARKVLDSLR